MTLHHILIICLLISFSDKAFSQDKLFYNRLHYFTHQDCQHPIGTIIKDKVFMANHANNMSFMNFNNSEGDIALVELIHYGKYTAYNQFVKTDFLKAGVVPVGLRTGVESYARSISEARSQLRVDKVKDTTVNDVSLKHIRIEPKDTLVHRFDSYHLLINTKTKTETPLYTEPSIYFLLQGQLPDLKGIVVQTYFVDLQGYIFCQDLLSGFEIINKRVIVK